MQIPEAEPAVRAWRERLDPGAREGVPAHGTVLFPFLREDCLDGAVLRALGEVLAAHPAFPVRFESCGRFPGVLYLAPEPDGPFRQLTRAIATGGTRPGSDRPPSGMRPPRSYPARCVRAPAGTRTVRIVAGGRPWPYSRPLAPFWHDGRSTHCTNGTAISASVEQAVVRVL
ncbi:2'-5' RNA ligase family protein [Streptomyces sioyaensis]|uniref:2'-5' RNA ligase family protein n=1 Tax=Streptomyces sioyaensis TaxID=67364 RepID=UPI0037B6BABE